MPKMTPKNVFVTSDTHTETQILFCYCVCSLQQELYIIRCHYGSKKAATYIFTHPSSQVHNRQSELLLYDKYNSVHLMQRMQHTQKTNTTIKQTNKQNKQTNNAVARKCNKKTSANVCLQAFMLQNNCGWHCNNYGAAISLQQMHCNIYIVTIALKQLHWNNCRATIALYIYGTSLAQTKATTHVRAHPRPQTCYRNFLSGVVSAPLRGAIRSWQASHLPSHHNQTIHTLTTRQNTNREKYKYKYMKNMHTFHLTTIKLSTH